MAEPIKSNLGELPEVISADCGYYNCWELEREVLATVDLFVPPENKKREYANPNPAASRMREKLRSEEGKAIYDMRSSTVEPVFGNVKSL